MKRPGGTGPLCIPHCFSFVSGTRRIAVLKPQPATKKKRQTRAQQTEEARGIQNWQTIYRRFGLDLIYRTAKRAKDPEEAPVLFANLMMIASCLATTGRPDWRYERWEHTSTIFAAIELGAISSQRCQSSQGRGRVGD